MENKKDLSRDFAIIFGIKPEEVPSNSLGNIRQLIEWNKRLLEKLYPSYPEAIERLAQINSSVGIEKPEKACETKENLIKARSNELKQYSNMENSKTKDIMNENKSESKSKDTYIVSFKDNRQHIKITENMFNHLLSHANTSYRP